MVLVALRSTIQILVRFELATHFQAQAGFSGELLPELEQKIAQLREFGLDPGKEPSN